MGSSGRRKIMRISAEGKLRAYFENLLDRISNFEDG
jgi:hypothetical protein